MFVFSSNLVGTSAPHNPSIHSYPHFDALSGIMDRFIKEMFRETRYARWNFVFI
jgi:hypothetical protein